MYSRKSAVPRMGPWGTPASSGYYGKDFPFRTTQSPLLLRKKELRPNIWHKIPLELSLWKRPAGHTLWKALDISSATVQVALDLLKALAILSDTTKPNWRSENWLHFSWWSTTLLSISFSNTLLTTERRLTGRYVLAVDLSQTFLNAVTTNIFMPLSLYQYLYTIIQYVSFRHILNSSASIYKSSGSTFFRTTTGIQSESDAFDESRLVMAFLIIFGVTKILCNFRLDLEGKTGKEIPESSKLEFLEKFLTILLYQIQNAEPLGCWIEEVLQIYLCWKHN